VDYHGRDDDPSDFVTGCPAHHHEPALQAAVFEMIRWDSDLGGLEGVTGRPASELPARLVDLFLESLAAQSRFVAWRDRATAKALEK
jgi:hypothetical protein